MSTLAINSYSDRLLDVECSISSPTFQKEVFLTFFFSKGFSSHFDAFAKEIALNDKQRDEIYQKFYRSVISKASSLKRLDLSVFQDLYRLEKLTDSELNTRDYDLTEKIVELIVRSCEEVLVNPKTKPYLNRTCMKEDPALVEAVSPILMEVGVNLFDITSMLSFDSRFVAVTRFHLEPLLEWMANRYIAQGKPLPGTDNPRRSLMDEWKERIQRSLSLR